MMKNRFALARFSTSYFSISSGHAMETSHILLIYSRALGRLNQTFCLTFYLSVHVRIAGLDAQEVVYHCCWISLGHHLVHSYIQILGLLYGGVILENLRIDSHWILEGSHLVRIRHGLVQLMMGLVSVAHKGIQSLGATSLMMGELLSVIQLVLH